jgi:glutamate-1-semialdehyde 2,1-aminomutase
MTISLQQRAEAVMPAGVNSPVRAFKSVGGKPIYARSAKGAYLETVDGRKLIDFCMSFGPLILGHAHPRVVEAIRTAAERGTSFAVTTEAEIEMAEFIRARIPSMEMVRLVSSGTEAAMTALRLGRGATGRGKILKFTGCYHGHSDSLLVEAGSGVAGIAEASSAGVPDDLAAQTLVAPYNDLDAATRVVEEHARDLACIAVEPVAGNMGVVLPKPGYLEHLRKLADQSGALLLFDEVITGFRITCGGYQNICGVTPDLTCLGKIIGGGMPIGAVGGRADLMENIAPLGNVYQAGTLSGNPISVAAGLACLRTLHEEKPYPELEKKTVTFTGAMKEIFEAKGLTVQLPTIGSLFNMFFIDQPVHTFDDVMKADKEPFVKLFNALLERNVYLAPSPFEAGFLSVAHTDEVLNETLDALKAAAATL